MLAWLATLATSISGTSVGLCNSVTDAQMSRMRQIAASQIADVGHAHARVKLPDIVTCHSNTEYHTALYTKMLSHFT